MTDFLVILLALLLPQLWGLYKRWGPAGIMAMLGLSIIAVSLIQRLQGFVMNMRNDTHDTYYVVTHFHYFLALSVLPLIVMATLYAAQRTRTPPPARLTRALALSVALSLTLSIAGPALVPLAYNLADGAPSQSLLTIAHYSALALQITMVLAATLLALAAVALMRALIRRVRGT